MKYRKKPIVVDVYQWMGDPFEFKRWEAEVTNNNPLSNITIHRNKNNENELHIVTLEGTMIASQMDYVIRGVEGEFYPCKPHIFKSTYEKV